MNIKSKKMAACLDVYYITVCFAIFLANLFYFRDWSDDVADFLVAVMGLFFGDGGGSIGELLAYLIIPHAAPISACAGYIILSKKIFIRISWRRIFISVIGLAIMLYWPIKLLFFLIALELGFVHGI